MFTPRALAILAIVMSMSANGQSIQNGGFTAVALPRIADGSMPPNKVTAWSAAYGTPQIILEQGCNDDNYIAMWGNGAAGEAIAQPVPLKKGVTYDVSLCARYRKGNIPFANIVLRASAAPLTSPACPAATCEAMQGATHLTSTTWTPIRFRFTPSRDSGVLTVSTSNDNAINDGAQVSWAEVDNIAIAPAGGDGANEIINEKRPDAIPGQFIVVFKPAVTAKEIEAAEATVVKAGAVIEFRYTTSVKGFSVKTPLDRLASVRSALLSLPGVAWIEANTPVSIKVTTQLNPPKGLDRTDHRTLPLNNKYIYTETGFNVHAYVIDTGIRITHNEFTGRASGAFTAINDGNGSNDCNGHGTHVAGTIGGITYGIAKLVTLHAVRVLDCNGSGTVSGVVAGVDWVTNNRIPPAVANMSLGGGSSLTLDTAVTTSIGSGVTYAVAAGNSNVDACTVSPAETPAAITVGAIDPTNDTRANFSSWGSNWGACVDLFGPGVGITSAWNTSNTATNTISGTSMATPHVAGVAALYLQFHAGASPATVLAGIHYAADVSTTPLWPGVINRGPNSPNELLHWGAYNDGYDDGDPHISTVDGAHYDFQSAGEFVLLRDGNAMEIQTRQTPVATTSTNCVSLNTAVAARVGTHRVTYEPNVSGVPDPSGMQLRIDGTLTTLGAQGVNLAGGGRVTKPPAGDGIEIDFPDDTMLTATANWWASQSKWYLNVHVLRTRATDGIMGAIAPGSWLPALPNGTSMGPQPAIAHQRYVDLNQTFANAWRVTNASSLFDYAPGTSTATFTIASWPPETGPCTLPKSEPVKPVDAGVAQQACTPIGEKLKADCVFDVMVTGETGFAKAYAISQQIQSGGTSIVVNDDRDPTYVGDSVTFVATVRSASTSGQRPYGTVVFMIDGARASEPLRIDDNGRATFRTTTLSNGTHQVSARFNGENGSLSSTSANEPHTVHARISIDTTLEQPRAQP